MKKKMFITHALLTLIIIIVTMYEIIKYFTLDSNIYGLFSSIINIFIIFLLITTTLNYPKSKPKIRFSKMIMILIFFIFSAFILPTIINNVLYYQNTLEIQNKLITLTKSIIFLLLTINSYLATKLR